MKVLDLQCTHAHSFEGWFASEDDYQDQLTRGLLTCPLCGSDDVRKKLSAPRLNLNTTRGDASHASAVAASGDAVSSAAQQAGAAHPGPSDSSAALPAVQPAQALAHMGPEQLQAAWLHMTRQVLAQTEDVGDRFATEARRMHHGEVAHRNIRGQASAAETEALLDEGIAVMPLLIPEALKGPVQ
jgi:hypothetical protein